MVVSGFLLLILFNTNAQQNVIDSLENAISASNPDELKEIYLQLSNEWKRTDLNKAEYYSRKLISVSHGDKEKEGLGNFNLATVNFYRNNSDSSFFYLEKALHFFEAIHDTSLVASAWMIKGNIYENLGEYEKTVDANMKSLELFKKVNNVQGIGNISLNLGNVFVYLKQYDRSFEYYQAASKIFRKEGRDYMLGKVLNNIGLMYEKQEMYDTALVYLEEAIEIQKQTNNIMSLPGSLMNLGMCYMKLEKYDKALESYETAYYLFKENTISIGILKSLYNLGELHLILNNDSAEIYLLDALKLAEEISSKDMHALIFKTLSAFYYKKGNYKLAYEYRVKHFDLYKEVFEDRKLHSIEEIQTKYETEKKEFDNKFLKEKAEIQERLKYSLFFIISALVILAILLFYFFRMKSNLLEQKQSLEEVKEKQFQDSIFAEKQINQLQREKIKHKNRELSTATLQIINKNNILSEISLLLQNGNDDDNTELSEKICITIKESIGSDEDWKQFKRHFEEVHIGFFDKLKTKHEDLTNNDLKLCAYIRINLTSKEIAQILHNTPDTINKSRYRLRKKLNLNSDENLNEFIMNV